MEEKLFGIGQVAALFHLSVSTLRYYEKNGLLLPEFVNPDSGYRYYSARQFEVLNTIRYLRVLDMPLPEIADFLRNREVFRMEEKLTRQKAAVQDKIEALSRIERKIDNRLQTLREAQSRLMDEIFRVTLPACRMIFMRDALHPRGFLDMEAPIRELDENLPEAAVFLGKVGVCISPERLAMGRFEEYDGIFLRLDPEDRVAGAVLSLPKTPAIRICFHGSHGEAANRYRKLMDYLAQNGLEAAGFSREVTLIDEGFTPDPAKFVTEIAIPYREKQ